MCNSNTLVYKIMQRDVLFRQQTKMIYSVSIHLVNKHPKQLYHKLYLVCMFTNYIPIPIHPNINYDSVLLSVCVGYDRVLNMHMFGVETTRLKNHMNMDASDCYIVCPLLHFPRGFLRLLLQTFLQLQESYILVVIKYLALRLTNIVIDHIKQAIW